LAQSKNELLEQQINKLKALLKDNCDYTDKLSQDNIEMNSRSKRSEINNQNLKMKCVKLESDVSELTYNLNKAEENIKLMSNKNYVLEINNYKDEI